MKKDKTKIAIYIKESGETTEIQPRNGKNFTLYELQQYVDGLIDIVVIPNSEFIYVVNDEGIFTKHYNCMASLHCSIKYKTPCSLYGDVIYCHTSMVK